MSVRTGTVYDLHAAHVNSGATDTEQVPSLGIVFFWE